MANTQIVVQYQKNGAVFDDAVTANLDRFVRYTELFNQSKDDNLQMVQSGVFEQPIQYNWNPETFTLTLTKIITDIEGYNTLWLPLKPQIEQASAANGWTELPAVTTTI